MIPAQLKKWLAFGSGIGIEIAGPRGSESLHITAVRVRPNGARVLSYLLFERRYCRHLMHLGYMDAMKQRERILDFLGYESPLRRHSGGRHSEESLTACASVLRVTAAGP